MHFHFIEQRARVWHKFSFYLDFDDRSRLIVRPNASTSSSSDSDDSLASFPFDTLRFRLLRLLLRLRRLRRDLLEGDRLERRSARRLVDLDRR